jgi:hypothetical protein
MPRRGILERFRPAAPPGSAGPVGVPSDATPDPALLEVLAALRPVHDEADGIRADARAKVAEILTEAATQAAAAAARARVDGAEQRTAAAAEAHRAGRRTARRMAEDAVSEADRIRQRGRSLLPELVARVLDNVRSEAGLPGAPQDRS